MKVCPLEGAKITKLDVITDAPRQIIHRDKQILPWVFANVINGMERGGVFNYNKLPRLIESTCGIMKFFPSIVRAQTAEIKRGIKVKQNAKGRKENAPAGLITRERQRFSLSCEKSRSHGEWNSPDTFVFLFDVRYTV